MDLLVLLSGDLIAQAYATETVQTDMICSHFLDWHNCQSVITNMLIITVNNNAFQVLYVCDANLIEIWLQTGNFVLCLVWCFKSHSTAMVMSRRSVHLTTLFSSARLTSTSRTNSWISGRRRMITEIILWSSFTKVWDRAGIELGTPGSAVRLTTDCPVGLSYKWERE